MGKGEAWGRVSQVVGDYYVATSVIIRWLTRLIITSDKTKIRGDLLIDDKPYITGSEYPAWEHVLFTAPYNSELPVDGRHVLMPLSSSE